MCNRYRKVAADAIASETVEWDSGLCCGLQFFILVGGNAFRQELGLCTGRRPGLHSTSVDGRIRELETRGVLDQFDALPFGPRRGLGVLGSQWQEVAYRQCEFR